MPRKVDDRRGCKQCGGPINRTLHPRSAFCSESCGCRYWYLHQPRPPRLVVDPNLGEVWHVGPSRTSRGWWGAECFVCSLMTYDHDNREVATRSLLAHLQSEHERKGKK